MESKPGSLLVVSLEKALGGGQHLAFSHLGVVDRWLATSKRARYSALIPFS